MKKMQQQRERNWLRVLEFFGLGIITGLILLISVARLTWHSKFYPGVTIAGIDVAGLTRDQAHKKLTEAIHNYQIKLSFNGVLWDSPKDAVLTEIDATLNESYHYGRRLAMGDYLLLLINKKTNYPLTLSQGKTEVLEQLINEIASAVEIPPIEPTVEVKSGKIVVSNGTDGTVLDGELLDQRVRDNYRFLRTESIVVPTKVAINQLAQTDLEQLKIRAESLFGKTITLTLDDEEIKLEDKELVALLSTKGGSEIFNNEATKEYIAGLSNSLNKNPQDARFEFAEGKVTEFSSGKDGVEVSLAQTEERLKDGILKLLQTENKTETIEVAALRTPPKITTDKVNELGIRERIGRGESYYQHSIPNRIFNVSLASSRLNSALIAPGEEISFNNLVGEVSSATGYRQAYIISGGRTVLGDGGGLCQVSTTMFRAAMSAGLPILERWGHAYRVSYYELNSKPGVDATVIAPSKDFRFKNDTPGHILIQTINDPKNLHLVIEIYGTSDGRVATISDPKVWGNTPALPTIYQDDPTLPTGTLKQVDWAATGAKASFEYKVVKNGETLEEKTFSTTYRPWASVFLKGTGI